MRIAVISDIHANIYAFEEVVKDIKDENPDRIIFLGDLVINGLYPQECFDLLKELKAFILIKGNTDAWFEEIDDKWKPKSRREELYEEMLIYCKNNLNPNSIENIKSWEFVKTINIFNNKITFCHGSPFSYSEQIDFYKTRQKEFIGKIKEIGSNIVISGHTHKPIDISVNELHFLNFGAIGYSLDGNTSAKYGLLTINESKYCYALKELKYNKEKYIKDLKRSKKIFAENICYMIKHGIQPKI